jgi:PilZ domain
MSLVVSVGVEHMVALLRMPAYTSEDPWQKTESRSQENWANRRTFPRKETQGEVVGRRLDHTIEARQEPRLSLHLRDLSLGGLSALSDRPLNKGEHLTVTFPPKGTLRGWDAFGRVLRCDPSGLGYRVALEFDPLPAA